MHAFASGKVIRAAQCNVLLLDATHWASVCRSETAEGREKKGTLLHLSFVARVGLGQDWLAVDDREAEVVVLAAVDPERGRRLHGSRQPRPKAMSVESDVCFGARSSTTRKPLGFYSDFVPVPRLVGAIESRSLRLLQNGFDMAHVPKQHWKRTVPGLRL